MQTFQIGETVVLKSIIKKSGALYDPLTHVKVTVYDTDGKVKVDAASPDNESIGVYSYNLNTTGYADGKYRFRFVATDSGKISKKDGAFRLED